MARGRRLLLGAAVVPRRGASRSGGSRCSGPRRGRRRRAARSMRASLALVPLDRRCERGELGLGEPGGRGGRRRVEARPDAATRRRPRCGAGRGLTSAGEVGGGVGAAAGDDCDLLVVGGQVVEVGAVGQDGADLLAQRFEARVEDGGLGVEPGRGGGELVALAGRGRPARRGGRRAGPTSGSTRGSRGPGTLEAGQRVGPRRRGACRAPRRPRRGPRPAGSRGRAPAGRVPRRRPRGRRPRGGPRARWPRRAHRSRRRGGGVVGRAADRAAGADGQLAGDLGGHAVEALLADLHERLAGEQPRLGRRGKVAAGPPASSDREAVGRAGGEHPRADRDEVAVEGGDLDHRLAGRGEARLEVGQGLRHLLRPGGEPVELGRELLAAQRRATGGPTRPR